MTTPMAVGIVVVNYNSAGFIRAFLESLQRLDYPHARLVVVDSASQDGSLAEILRYFPGAHVVRCHENVGTARGNNLGVAACRSLGLDYALILNNDTTLEADALRWLVEAGGERQVVVPRILHAEDPRLINSHAGRFDWNLGLFRKTRHGKPDTQASRVRRTLETASFCCALLPARAFEEVGPLDEAFFMYYEETDFIRRAREVGYSVLYVPEAVVYHAESSSSGGGWMTPFKYYYATRNRLYLMRKAARSRWAYALFVAFFSITRVPVVLAFVASGNWKLLRSLRLGISDYVGSRMGRTLELKDF